MPSTSKTSSRRGFTLMEMMISMAVGLLVLGVAVQIYSKGTDVTWIVTQRAEMQQDARAAENLLAKDISLANAGLSDSPQYLGVALATGGANRPTFGGDYTGACHLGPANNACYNYPVSGTSNYLFGVVPGWGKGPTISAAVGATDAITIVYLDTFFQLDDYQFQFVDINGHDVIFTVPNGTVPAGSPNPTPNPLPQAISNSAVGLQRGDLVMFLNGTSAAIAEVTTAPGVGSAPPYDVGFANASPLGFNQDGATGGNIQQSITKTAANVGTVLSTSTFKAFRVWVITYYIDKTRPTPTLMRLVNGRLPVPVAENVVDLRFTYDTYDANGNLLNNTGDGGLTSATPIMPSAIRTINLVHMTVRSQVHGSLGFQAIDMHTSISARNLGFINRYN